MTDRTGPNQEWRRRALLNGVSFLVAPFLVLLLRGSSEAYLRAIYALCLVAVMAWGGFWIAFRANGDRLVRGWIPDALKPAAAIGVRICGLLVLIGALGFIGPDTARDVVDLVTSGKPDTWVETAGRVEGKLFLHPWFQTVWLRREQQWRRVYLFAYGGQRLVEGRRYVVSALPRSHWILSAHEELRTASR